jgi:hypothetical protein
MLIKPTCRTAWQIIHMTSSSSGTAQVLWTQQQTKVATFSYMNQLTPCSTVHLEKLVVAQIIKKSPPFMKPQCLLLYLQHPATGPHHEQDQSILHCHILFSNKIVFSNPLIHTRVSQMCSALQAFWPKCCKHSSFLLLVLHAPHISSLSILSPFSDFTGAWIDNWIYWTPVTPNYK